MPEGPEDIAREQIDRMLEQAGWAVQDAKEVNLYAKRGVAIREFELKPGFGTADYLLYVVEILTNSSTHPDAIKVRLENGAVGRVQLVLS